MRRSAVSTFSDMSTVTTAGIGVITWRACCSCRWKTPDSIPASPGSSFPPRELRAMSSFRSSADETSSNSARGSTPTSRRIAFEADVQRPDQRAERDAEPLQRPGDAQRRALGMDDRVDLRHLLAEGDVEAVVRGRRWSRDRQRATPCRSSRRTRPRAARDRGLAQEADAQRGHRDPELAGRQVLVDPVDLLRASAAPRTPSSLHLLEPWLAGAHEARTRRPRRSRWRPPAQPLPPGTKALSLGSARARDRGPAPATSRKLVVAHSAKRARVAGGYATPSILPANTKSFSVSPPSEWVLIVTVTLFHEISRSG